MFADSAPVVEHAPTQPITIRAITHMTPAILSGLADVTLDCVQGGASVGFMLPFDKARAQRYWEQQAPDIASGMRQLFVAEDAAGLMGTVSLVHAGPENQPHRADVAKMLVHRRARRRGIGAELMRAAEAAARAANKTILVLDTASADAERLYERLGWQRVGTIPDFALLPSGGYCDTHLFYRRLA